MKKKLLIIVIAVAIVGLIVAIYMIDKQKEPVEAVKPVEESIEEVAEDPVMEDIEESIEEVAEDPVMEDIEEFENGDKVVMDASGETYIEPEYSPDLVEVARQWASKVDRKFADDNDMVHEFMADDAYIDYIINGTIEPEQEPVQQPQKQPQQQGNQGQQQQQPTQQPSDGGATIDDTRNAFSQFGVDVSSGADAGEIGDWELPGNVHVE